MSKKNHSQKSAQPSKLVDIVIPVYRSFDLLEKCLASIPAAAKEISYNVIIVDNGSLAEEADKFYGTIHDPLVIVIRNKENMGFPKACNQGARRKNSPLLFFLNSDVVLYENAITNLVMAMDDPEVGIAGVKLLFPKGSPSGPAGKIQHVGLASDIRGDMVHLFSGWNPDHPKVLAVRDVLSVTGAALMIRRGLFQQVGGFGEEYGLGTWEDADLCLKVMANGKLVRVVQGSVGEHWTGATTTRHNQPFPLNANRMIFMSKWAGHYPWSLWLHV